jgi:hypothetical protein
VRPLARLAQLEHRAPGEHFTAMPQKTLEHLLEVQQPRLAIDQRHHVHAEGVLQLRLLVQAVEHHLGDFTALELDDHAHARLVGLVAQIGDALDALVVDQLADLFEQRPLVHLIRQLVDDDRLAVALFEVLEMRPATHHHPPAPGPITFADTGNAVDDAGRRKIGSRHDGDQFVDRHLRVAQQGQTGVHHLTEVVRRNVRRHAYRDTRRTVDQQVRNARRHDQRLLLRAVVVGPEIDRFLVDIGQQLVADSRHAHFGVAHRRRIVAVYRAEVALPVDQHVAQGKILRHAHDRVVDRRYRHGDGTYR